MESRPRETVEFLAAAVSAKEFELIQASCLKEEIDRFETNTFELLL